MNQAERIARGLKLIDQTTLEKVILPEDEIELVEEMPHQRGFHLIEALSPLILRDTFGRRYASTNTPPLFIVRCPRRGRFSNIELELPPIGEPQPLDADSKFTLQTYNNVNTHIVVMYYVTESSRANALAECLFSM